ncbi:hypothetical protein SHKM778_56180 [Streptomyces sp. KM77-8]|uniref:Uncharacterized protein n=1 Tax=Streptomyces haneummycinicus TaxID=3074435 RepID=A0AAT9HP83_9ACTN
MDLARVGAASSGQQVEQAGLGVARGAEDGDDLALAHLDGEVADSAAVAESPDDKTVVVTGFGPCGAGGDDVPADHVPHQGGTVQFAGGGATDQSAVAQDRDPVGHGHDLVDVVRDVDDGDALVAQPAHQGAYLSGVLGAQTGGRLVEDQRLAAPAHLPRDLDHGLLGDGQRAGDAGDVDADAEAGQGRAGPVADGFPVDGAEGPGRQVAQHDVLGDGEAHGQFAALRHGGDAEAARPAHGEPRVPVAVHLDGARVGLVHPGQHLDEGGLAGAVHPHQGVDLARV